MEFENENPTSTCAKLHSDLSTIQTKLRNIYNLLKIESSQATIPVSGLRDLLKGQDVHQVCRDAIAEDKVDVLALAFAWHGLGTKIHPEYNFMKSEEKRMTALHFAAKRGSVKCTSFLLEQNLGSNLYDPDVRDYQNSTPLLTACTGKVNRIEIIKLLLEKGADPGAVDSSGNSCLHRLVCRDSQNPDIRTCCEILLEALKERYSHGSSLPQTVGVTVNTNNMYGDTPLHKACRYGCWRTVETFLLAGADINFKNETGDTPLHCLFDGYFRSNARYPYENKAIRKTVSLMLKFCPNLSIRNGEGFLVNELPWAKCFPVSLGKLNSFIKGSNNKKSKGSRGKFPFSLMSYCLRTVKVHESSCRTPHLNDKLPSELYLKVITPITKCSGKDNDCNPVALT
eukprot:Nk52_evm65s223 gene=Nk52_evmTU65s223